MIKWHTCACVVFSEPGYITGELMSALVSASALVA